jgi:2'-5' RNA ligase
MRLFVALELDPGVRKKIQDIVISLSSKYKDLMFLRPENLHFTLKFIGEIPESGLDKIKGSIESSVNQTRPFNIHINGLGYFGPRKSPRIVWIGVSEGAQSLISLAGALESGLSSFKKEERPLSPHITICRLSRPVPWLTEEIDGVKDSDFGAMAVRSVMLKKSILKPEGAVYENIQEFALGR